MNVGAKPSSALPIHRALYAARPRPPLFTLCPENPGDSSGRIKSVGGRTRQHVRVGTLKVLVIGGDNAKLAAQTVEASLGDAQAVCVDALGVFGWADNLALALSNMESLEEMAVSSSGDAAQRSPAPRGDENERESVAAQATKVAEDAVRLACPAASSASQTLSEVCKACGTCSNSGGSVPSAQYELALQALQRLTEDELVALVVEATREVLAEKGLL